MQSQTQAPSQSPRYDRYIDRLLIIGFITTVACALFFVSHQLNPENATLAQLHEVGLIRIIVYDPHHEHHLRPSVKCPNRSFIGYIPRIKRIKAVFTVSKITGSQSDDIAQTQIKLWEWRKDTELYNGQMVIQPIEIRQLTPGAYRARLTVEKNGEKITVSTKSVLTIPESHPREIRPPHRCAAFFCQKIVDIDSGIYLCYN
ncbi:hypothetical protein HYZ64_01260 [Candidatus Berkelbacteria bacterium]|nr:hypothetical protein [Candidatus Berkelbacteria bacterium]